MSSSKNLEFEKTSFLNKSNSIFIEDMYLKFINNDPALPESWRKYFSELGDDKEIIINEINGPSWKPFQRIKVNDRKEEANANDTLSDVDTIRSNAN